MFRILLFTLLYLRLANGAAEARYPYFGLQFLFHGERFRHIKASLDCRSLIDAVHPLTKILELLDINTSPFSAIDPAEVGNVRYRHPVSNDPWAVLSSRLALFNESVFKHLIQPLRLGLVSLDAVFNLLRGVTVEVVCLTLT